MNENFSVVIDLIPGLGDHDFDDSRTCTTERYFSHGQPRGGFYLTTKRRLSRVRRSFAPHSPPNAPGTQVFNPMASTSTLLLSTTLLWLLERLAHSDPNPCRQPPKGPMTIKSKKSQRYPHKLSHLGRQVLRCSSCHLPRCFH